MPQDKPHQISADDVLKDIERELKRPAPAGPPILELMNKATQRQHAFRNKPVLGNLLLLKNLIFGLNRSTFSQQFEINDLMLELVDDLYHEIRRNETLTNQRLAQLEALVYGQQVTGQLQSPARDPNVPLLAGLPTIYSVPAEMMLSERLLLYSLIYGLKPAICLEIGVFRGGSALIICAALDDVGAGRLIGVDPAPKISTADWERLSNRTELISEASPGGVAKAFALVQQPFDFALIDGDHTYQGVVRDIDGVLPCLAQQAHLLFHDCHHPQVAQAIDAALARYPGQLTDCGVLSVDKSEVWQQDMAGTADWGGFRLLRFVKNT